jgi:hypothetical protein
MSLFSGSWGRRLFQLRYSIVMTETRWQPGTVLGLGLVASDPTCFLRVEVARFFSHRRCARRIRLMAGRYDADHPTDSEAVREHAETRRPERFRERHFHLAALR